MYFQNKLVHLQERGEDNMCGIFGIINLDPNKKHLDFVTEARNAFQKLQDRGQDGAGVSYTDGNSVWVRKGFGLIRNVIDDSFVREIAGDKPCAMIFHNRYATSGDVSSRNLQPQWGEPLSGKIALVHNGNIPNAEEKREPFIKDGVYFETDNDTECMRKAIHYFIERERMSHSDAIKRFMNEVDGSYAVLMLARDYLYAFRDPWGNRPLFIFRGPDYIAFSSETCAFAELRGHGAVDEIAAGELVSVSLRHKQIEKTQVRSVERKAHCVFCNVYFLQPTSLTFDFTRVALFRFGLGAKLAQLYPLHGVEVVTYLPRSGQNAAEGYAATLNRRLVSAWILNEQAGVGGVRTFIRADQNDRQDACRQKHILIPEFIQGKSVALIDDSIVRGTTIRTKVEQMRAAGASEVHILSSFPPVKNCCYYGINLPTKDELIAATHATEEIRAQIGADSLSYMTLDGLRDVVRNSGGSPDQYCFACTEDDNYPIPLRRAQKSSDV